MRKRQGTRHAAREWVGGRFPAPFGVVESGPIRPQLTMWIELPQPLIVGTQLDDPAAPTPFPATLKAAMERPLAGSPRRPGRVRVADAKQAAELRAAFPDLEVIVAPTPELDLLAADLGERLSDTIGADASYFEDGAVSPGAVRQLFEAAAELYAIAPWKTAPTDFHLRLDVEELGIQGACVTVIGALGETFGFAVFPSLEALHAFEEAIGDEADIEGPLDLGTDYLALTFENGDELPCPRRCSARRPSTAGRWRALRPTPSSSNASPTE